MLSPRDQVFRPDTGPGDRHPRVKVGQECWWFGETVESNEEYVVAHCPAGQFVLREAMTVF